MTPPDRKAFLGIDTATVFLALAVVDDAGIVIARRQPRLERDHAARIVDELDGLLRDAGMDRTELAAVGVGTGPGSYTGLRVGIAAAKGLASGLGTPVVGSDTLAAIASGGLAAGTTGAAAIDARRGNAYIGVYRKHGTDVVAVEAPTKVARDAFLAHHPDLMLLEGLAPDAAHHAREAARAIARGRTLPPVEPIYL